MTMTELQLNRALTAMEQSAEDRALLETKAEPKRPPLAVRIAAHKAAEKAALRRQYIAKGIARQQEA
jgi:hypothetical protein